MKIKTSSLDYRFSDKAHANFILDVMRTTAKIETMTALDNLKMALRKVREEQDRDDSDDPFFIDDSKQM